MLTVVFLGVALALVFATLFSVPLVITNAQESQIVSTVSFTKTLRGGMTDNQVRGLQEFLKQFPDVYPERLVTGYFGPLTENAVKRFQIKEGIEAVGIVGPKTRAKLNELAMRGTTGPLVTIASNGATLLAEEVDLGLPIRLKIPKINVDATFEYVGLTPEGDMVSPKGPAPAGWFNLGPRPGEIGNAVIDGHSGWKNNIPAVFDNLHKLVKGDKIYVEDEKGVITTFVVREIREYDPNAYATDVFVSSDGGAHLNLITCTGLWDEVLKSRSDRLVVFTDKEM